MNNYEKIAINALEKIFKGQEPEQAWENASIEIFGKGTSGQKKSCPRNSFLGLCEDGFILGVEKGNYLKKANSKNKAYAIKSIHLIKNDSSLLNQKSLLWGKITNITYNQQLDVVFSLINNGYIKI
jgi:hypothetical protein